MSAVAKLRRGWCPSVLRPMPTGDGWLVRVEPPGGVLSASQARAVAEAALACGNGCIDLTGRGNLQIRGVGPATHPALVERLAAHALAGGEGPRRAIISPLACLGPADFIDARRLAERIEAALAGLAGLPDKLAIVVDGGGGLPLDDVDGDLRLVAIEPGRLMLGLAGPAGPLWQGIVSEREAPRLARTILSHLASLIRDEDAPRRIRDLTAAQRSAIAAGLRFLLPEGEGGLAKRGRMRGYGLSGCTVRPHPPPSGAPSPSGRRIARCPPRSLAAIGIIPLPNTTALLIAPPFGRCSAGMLAEAAEWSEAHGDGAIRLSPWRSLALAGVAADCAPTLAGKAAACGFIVDPADPRLAVAACPGAPACGRATTATHGDAEALALAAAPLIAAGLTLHVSGCAKGCARPGPAGLTLVGERGDYGVVLDGGPAHRPAITLPMRAILDRLQSARSRPELAAAFRAPAAAAR